MSVPCAHRSCTGCANFIFNSAGWVTRWRSGMTVERAAPSAPFPSPPCRTVPTSSCGDLRALWPGPPRSQWDYNWLIGRKKTNAFIQNSQKQVSVKLMIQLLNKITDLCANSHWSLISLGCCLLVSHNFPPNHLLVRAAMFNNNVEDLDFLKRIIFTFPIKSGEPCFNKAVTLFSYSVRKPQLCASIKLRRNSPLRAVAHKPVRFP